MGCDPPVQLGRIARLGHMIRLRLQKAVDTVLGKDQAKVALASVIVFPK